MNIFKRHWAEQIDLCCVDAYHAVQVFDFSKQGADKAFTREKAVLEALMASQKNEAEGAKTLPRLITTSTNIVGVSAASIVTQPVASPISAGSKV